MSSAFSECHEIMNEKDYDLHYPPITQPNADSTIMYTEKKINTSMQIHPEVSEQHVPHIVHEVAKIQQENIVLKASPSHEHILPNTYENEETYWLKLEEYNLPSKNIRKANNEKLLHISSTLSDTCSKSDSFAYDLSKDTNLTDQSYYSDGYFNRSLEKLYTQYMAQKTMSEEVSADEQTTGCFAENDNNGKKQIFGRCNTKQLVVIFTTLLSMMIAATAAAVLTLHVFHHNSHHYHGELQADETAEVYEKAAVVTGSSVCTKIGADILRKNGSAVDAAIAACFCLCVTAKHSTSIGGGGYMLTYRRESKEFSAYDFSSTAPGKAKMDMYDVNPNQTKYGGKYIAVPGLVKGLYETWQKHGILQWGQLLKPAINLTKHGLLVQVRSHEIADLMKSQLEDDPGLRKLLLSTNREPWFPGYVVIDESLTKTLESIAENPADFYMGDLANEIYKDVLKAGGFISLDDLANYKVKKRGIVSSTINSFQLFTIGAPTGGAVVTDVLNILKGYHFTIDDINEKDAFRTSATYHRLIEAIKFVMAHRTREGDPDFNDKDAMNELINNMTDEGFGEKIRQKINDIKTKSMMFYEPTYSLPTEEGGAQVSVIAPNGDAVSMTTTINGWYGSMYRSLETGIIYNNQMKTFSTKSDQLEQLPPSPLNSIHGGKRALTSMAPIIMLDKKGDVRFVLGGAGGVNLISAVAQVIINKLWFKDELGQALYRPRVFHDLLHINVTVEANFNPNIIEKLEARKHAVSITDAVEYSEVQAIYVDDEGHIHAKSDPRKYGHTDGF